jgi:hypothetical protein
MATVGMFKDLKKMKGQAKEIDKQSGRRGGIGGMKDAVSQASSAVDDAMAMQAAMALLQTGTPADATIKATRETGMEINMQRAVEFDLEVTLDGGTPYPVTTTTPLPVTMAPLAQPGSAIKVKVDPSDPSQLAIDWAATQMAQSGQG